MSLNTLLMDTNPLDFNGFKYIDNYYKSIPFKCIDSGYKCIGSKRI